MIREFDAELVEFADEVGPRDPVAVRGGATRWALGGPIEARARELRAPVGIVSYRPDEMTVEVRAGTRVSDLHDELEQAGQRTALPVRPGGTVGGALAVGESTVERLGRGQTRDALLQAVFVAADGGLVTAGGPTVKNVSGFDLARLLVGSLGTLGLIAAVILRTQPIPAREQWLRTDDADPHAVLDAARTAASILWNGTSTWVLLAGFEPDVDADLAGLGSIGSFTPDSPPSLPPHRWSRTPTQARSVDPDDAGSFVAEIGVGVVHAEHPDRGPVIEPGIEALGSRVKSLFDPTGRLNPGRRPGGR
jgi:glycolate oxidase FAD binding subunit